MSDKEKVEETAEVTILAGGAFLEAVTRNNKQLKTNMVAAIVEDTEIMLKRTIEDLEKGISRLKVDRENMLDSRLSNLQNLKSSSDFQIQEFLNSDINLSKSIRDEEIKLAILKERYEYLFTE